MAGWGLCRKTEPCHSTASLGSPELHSLTAKRLQCSSGDPCGSSSLMPRWVFPCWLQVKRCFETPNKNFAGYLQPTGHPQRILALECSKLGPNIQTCIHVGSSLGQHKHLEPELHKHNYHDKSLVPGSISTSQERA